MATILGNSFIAEKSVSRNKTIEYVRQVTSRKREAKPELARSFRRLGALNGS
jgi:hypothetical protein